MENNSPINFSKLRWLDLVRVLGAFLVVLMHINVFYKGPSWWVSSFFYFGITLVAVPLFFMASGYLLLSKNEPLKVFLQKRAGKILLPFLAWSVIYLIWKGEGLEKSLPSAMAAYIVRIANRPSEQHLWYLYELFGLYLFTPILRLYLQKAQKQDLYYFLGAWFILIPVVSLLREFTPIKLGLSYPFLGGYIGYFLFGYFVGHYMENPDKRIAGIIHILAVIITVFGLWYRAAYDVKSQYFEEYLSANVVLMSWSLFVLLKDIQISDRLYQFLIPLKNTSFGIYLVHMIVITELCTREPFAVITRIGSGLYMPLVMAVMGFTISFLIIYIMQKIPILKLIVPA